MKNKFVLDTSFISAFANPTDLHHNKALEIYSALPLDATCYVPRTVELEVLVYLKNYTVGAKLEQLFAGMVVHFIDIDAEFVSKFSKFVSTQSQPLKAIDNTVLLSAKIHKAKILTFDEKLAKAAVKQKN